MNILNVGLPLACWQGSLAQGERWNWNCARWSIGEVWYLKQVQLVPSIITMPRCRQISVGRGLHHYNYNYMYIYAIVVVVQTCNLKLVCENSSSPIAQSP